MVYSIIQKSQLEGAHRLDAEYYQPEYLEFSKNLLRMGEIPLGDLAFITDGQHGYHIVDPSSSINHITAKNVVSWIVNDENTDRLAKETNDKNKRSILEENDVLISTAGTTGETGLVTKAILPANIDQDVARIHISDQQKLNPKFLVAFLNSKYGGFQLARQTTGQIQTHISLDKIKKEIFVPTPAWQDKIILLVDDAISNYENSKRFYKEAENLLLEELRLKDFEIDDDLSYVVNLSEIRSSHRADAEYFQPKYDKIIQSLDKDRQLLKMIAKRKTIKAQILPTTEYNYIEISDVNVGSGEVVFNKVRGNELPANAKIQVDGGELIISKVRPTRGAVAVIPDQWNKNVITSGAFSVFEMQSPMREYLQVVLRSIIGKLQLEKPTTGTSYPTVTDEDIETLMIPILSKSTQQKIADLVRQSHEARKKAKELLEEAKRKVEELIEKESK